MPESGSGEAIALWEAAERVVSSPLLYPEARSALGRAARSQRLGRPEAARARALVERLWRDIDRVEVSEDVVREAGRLAETHALRAYDAVHLASARSVADDDLVLVAADRDLLAAARATALTTASLR